MARSKGHGRAERATPGRARVVVPASGTALLLIDVINDLAFDGSEALVAQAHSMATSLARFKRRAAAAGVPAIYINDNFGRWRSDFRRTVAHYTSRSSPGHRVSRRLRPTPRDYFVLKPKHSGFFDTTLDTLLEALDVRRVILASPATSACSSRRTMRTCGSTKFSRLPIAWCRTHRPTTISPSAKSSRC